MGFVLTQLPCGKQIILLSSDLSLTGAEVIEAYGWRFKIEVSFRTIVQLLGGFGYRFWLKSMETASRWPQNLRLKDYPQTIQTQIAAKVEANEALYQSQCHCLRTAPSSRSGDAPDCLATLSLLVS
jgi:hypothetical protein